MKSADKQILADAGRHLSEDFRRFCDYVREQEVTVPATTAALGKKDCSELNKQMFFRENYETADRLVTGYAVLHFFQYAAVRYGVLSLTHKTKSRLQYKRGEAYEQFSRLSAPAQYLLLFLCFSYEYIEALRRESWYEGTQLEYFFDLLAATEAGAEITAIPERQWSLRMEFYEYSYILRFLHECGLCEVEFYTPEEEKQAERSDWSVGRQIFSAKVKRMIVTEAGVIMGKWFASGRGSEEFLKEFVPEEWFLIRQVLERKEQEQTGVYDFQVKLGSCTRTIRLNGERTLERLHDEIQQAFCFDNDHLYYFSLGYGLMERKYYCPHMREEEYLVDEVKLQGLGLEAGDRFIYLFDFGDCWRFDVTAERIRPGSAETEGCIAGKNAPPSQYGYEKEPWEEEEVSVEAVTEPSHSEAEVVSPDLLIQDFYERYPDAGMLTERYLSAGGRLEKRLESLQQKLQQDIDMKAGNVGVQMSLELLTGTIQDNTPDKAEGFRICRMPGSWSDALAVSSVPELRAMHEKIGVRCKSVGSKEKLQRSLIWHFSSSEEWMDILLDEDSRSTLRYIYEREGCDTDRRLAYGPLAKLMALGLIEIRFPKPEWEQKCLPAIVFVEEGKEILYDKL